MTTPTLSTAAHQRAAVLLQVADAEAERGRQSSRRTVNALSMHYKRETDLPRILPGAPSLGLDIDHWLITHAVITKLIRRFRDEMSKPRMIRSTSYIRALRVAIRAEARRYLRQRGDAK